MTSAVGPHASLNLRQNTSFLKNCDPSFLTRMAQHLEKQALSSLMLN